MHCAGNYFSPKETSSVDIELAVGTTGSTYLATLHYWLSLLIKERRPDIIFFQAGVDVLASDRLGKLNMCRESVRKRNAMVYQKCFDTGTPLVITMGGGYPKNLDSSSNEFDQVVSAHSDVYIQAGELVSSVMLGQTFGQTLNQQNPKQ